jgi:signal transduction histidine kinase
MIEAQKNELQEAYKKLRSVISELEITNSRLNKSNIDLQEAKKKAEESDKLKSAFLANVSHEIRTPLNSIVGFSSLLVDEDLDEETRRSYVDLIESNTESLLVLIDEIIDLSKIEAQQLSLKKQTFSIDSLITELYQIFTLNQKKPQIHLVINGIAPEKELFVFSDRVRVKQIFINLLSNAFKFTDEGTIEMGYVLLDTDEIALYVKDTGIGIDKDYHQIIFHRFRKLNENFDKKIYRGTGLGLAITEKLVELLGGKIWIESEPGKGSAFYFTLQGLKLNDVNA